MHITMPTHSAAKWYQVQVRCAGVVGARSGLYKAPWSRLVISCIHRPLFLPRLRTAVRIHLSREREKRPANAALFSRNDGLAQRIVRMCGPVGVRGGVDALHGDAVVD